MTLIGRISITLLTIVMAGAFAADGAMAEPDAPRSCTMVSPKGQITNFSASVELTESNGFTLFTYTLDTPGVNPDHAVLAMDCLPICQASFCSNSSGACTTTADCDDNDNQDVCVVDTECISDFGSPDNNGSSLNACGLGGDPITGIGFLLFSTMTMTANPEADTSTFFVEIAGPVTCDSGDIAVKNGKKLSACEICVPKTTLDTGAVFADSERIITIGECRFLRRFKNTGQLIETSVLLNDPSEPPCLGIVVSTDQDGNLISKFAGEGPLGPLPFVDHQLNVADGMGFADFGKGLQGQQGGYEYTTGSGTCVVLNDGFGGTGLTCTCSKPLSPGESAHCGKN